MSNMKFQSEDNRYMLVEYLNPVDIIMSEDKYKDFLDSLRKNNRSKNNTIICGNVSKSDVSKNGMIMVRYHKYHMLSSKTNISSLDNYTVLFDEEGLENELSDRIMTYKDYYPDINVAYFVQNDDYDIGIRYIPVLYKDNEIFLNPTVIKSLLYKYAEDGNYKFFTDLADRFEKFNDVSDYVYDLRTAIGNSKKYNFDKMSLYRISVLLFKNLILSSKDKSLVSKRRLRDFGLFVRDYGTRSKSPVEYNMFEKIYLRVNDVNDYASEILDSVREIAEINHRIENENDSILEEKELDRWDQERDGGYSFKLKL